MHKYISLSAILATVALAPSAMAQVEFYFSTGNLGDGNTRLTSDTVTSSSWVGEYDIIVENKGVTPKFFNAGTLMVGWGSSVTEGPTAIDTMPNAISLFNPGAANGNVNGNPNIPARNDSFFGGGQACRMVGGRGAAGPARPYGFHIPIDVPIGSQWSVSPGEKLFICRIKIKDNGLFAFGGSRDLVLYDAGYGGSYTTGLYFGPNPPLRAGVALWESTSRLTLNGPVSNQAPILAPIGNQTVDEETALSVDANASDPDFGQILTFSLSGEPAGMTINPSSGVISWTPTEAQGPGNYTFDVRVTDNGAPTAMDSETITVTVNEVNLAPTWSIVPAQNSSEGASFSLNVSPNASDADIPANTLSFSLVTGPSGLTVSSAGVVSWSPGESDGGTNPIVTVRATDNGTPNQTADVSFTISVSETNEPPVLVNPGTQFGAEGSLFSLQMSGSDPDLPGQMLTFAKVAGPAGLTVSPTGMVAWTPGESDGGTAPSVTVSLTDGTATVQQTFVLSVAEVNQPPVVEGVVDRYGVMGTLFWLVLDVTDPDTPANTFTYSLGAGAPSGMTLDAAGLLKWVPTGAQVGTHTFDINVTDNGVPAATTSRTVTMTVASAGQLESWGTNGLGSNKPGGTFIAVASDHWCGHAIRQSGQLVAWGQNYNNVQSGTPSGAFVSLDSTYQSRLALRNNLSLEGWGYGWQVNGLYNSGSRPSGTFVACSISPSACAAIRSNGAVVTWGNGPGQGAVPLGKFLGVSVADLHGAAIRSDGTIVGWGNNWNGAIPPPSNDKFRAVVTGGGGWTADRSYTLAIRTDGTLAAWGWSTITGALPSGTFLSVARAEGHAVALRSDGIVIAWGTGAFGFLGTPTPACSGIGTAASLGTAIRRNAPPVLTNPGTRSATEHQNFSLQLAATDTESAAATLTYSLVSGPAGMTVSSTGLVSWTPGESHGGTTVNATVRVSDGIDTDTQTFAINVAEANGAPVCVNDVETVARGTFKDIDVRANDTDPEGNTFLVTGVTVPFPNIGSVSIVSGGTRVRYAAPSSPLYRGKKTKFTYTVTDALGATASAQVEITIK